METKIEIITSFVISQKKHEIFRYKSNKTCTGLMRWKLQNADRKISKIIQLNGKAYSGYGLESSIEQLSSLPKLAYRFNIPPIKIPSRLLYNKIILKFMWKETIIGKTILKKNKVGGITLHNYLHSYRNQCYKVLAKRETYRSMEENTELKIVGHKCS